MRAPLLLLVLLNLLATPAWSKSRFFDLTVRDSKGGPVSGASVEGGAYPWPQTDRIGRVGVTSDATKLIVRKPGYKSAVVSLENLATAILSVSLQPSFRRASGCPAATEFKGGQFGKLSFPDMSRLTYIPGTTDIDFHTWKYAPVGDGFWAGSAVSSQKRWMDLESSTRRDYGGAMDFPYLRKWQIPPTIPKNSSR